MHCALSRLRGSVVVSVLALLLAPCVAAQKPTPKPAPALGMEIVESGSYPELHVDGKPFFVHSASFFYYRIPRDLWEKSLEAHAALGINTIDLYIPWNWHEPREGEFDFEGRTNPRRDLRGLLELIHKKGLRLIARPGPMILNEWRHGGYPEWLLQRPEYEMEAADRLEGRYPPLANLNARDAEASAQGWLNNATHMTYARRWLARVAQALAPYSARNKLRIKVPSENKKTLPEEIEVSGPLLFVQLDDDLAIGRANYAGPAFWRYVEELRAMVAAGGLDLPVFINPFDPRVAAAGSAQAPPIGVMGQWYKRPEGRPRQENAPASRLEPGEVSAIEFLTESLKTQPGFPPMMIEYNAGWYTPGDDERPLESPRENTLLSSRLLIGHGLQGFNHFPAQDSLAPAGYEVPWSNRHYRWDAALDLNAVRQPRSRALERTGQLLPLWGELLGSSHKRADFGVVNPVSAFAQEKLTRADVQHVAETVMKLERLAAVAGLATELADPQHQPVEQLLRHPLLLLPVPPQAEERLHLSEKAQRALVEYVREGGTLVFFPGRPAGNVLQEPWSGTPTGSGDPASAPSTVWRLGKGTVLESTKDFYSWLQLNESQQETRTHMEASWAGGLLHQFMDYAGVRPAVERAPNSTGADELYVTQRASNEGSGRLGERNGGRGLLSVINLSADGSAEATLRILSPRNSARAGTAQSIELPVTVPAEEALLLPLHFPLCAAAKPEDRCKDELTAAGGELLSVYRDGRSLEMVFYAPARAALIFRFAEQPRRARVDELGVDGEWNTDLKSFKLEITRGAAPTYLRTLRIDLRYEPFMPKKPEEKEGRRDYDYAVTDAVRLPLSGDAGLATNPPLILLDEESKGQMIVEARNYDEMGTRISVKVDGPVRDSELLSLEASELGFERLELKPDRDAPPGNGSGNGEILTGTLRLKGFGEERSSPVHFVRVSGKATTGYRFDFDRDGAEEWVLEDAHLRAIVSPEAGGRAVALVSKLNGLSLTTSVGALRDHFAYSQNPEGRRPERARGAAGLFNRAYHAEWVKEDGGPALRLTVEAPDVYPAGARVEKTLRLRPVPDTTAKPPADAKPQEPPPAWGGLEVSYRVSLAAVAAAKEPEPQAFVAVSSVPALLRGDRTTRFCWSAPGEAEEEKCERFQPGRQLALPEGATRMSIRTPGSNALLVEWTAGTMAVEMKNYSALLKLTFPPLERGGPAGEYKMRFEVQEAE